MSQSVTEKLKSVTKVNICGPVAYCKVLQYGNTMHVMALSICIYRPQSAHDKKVQIFSMSGPLAGSGQYSGCLFTYLLNSCQTLNYIQLLLC